VILDQTKQFQLLAVGWDENFFDNYKNFLAGKTIIKSGVVFPIVSFLSGSPDRPQFELSGGGFNFNNKN
jgi:hypothetical protein